LGGLDGDDAKLNNVTPANGTMVYNTNPSVTQEGLYVWNGTQWTYAAALSTLPITTVQVVVDGTPSSDSFIASTTPTLADDTIFRGRPIQLDVNLTPDNATSDNFGWSVSGAGARINADGLVTANRTGTISVRATSPNGIFGEKRFVVVNPRTPGSVTFPGGTYVTFDYNGIVWMVENLREETSDGEGYKTTYNDDGTDVSTGVKAPGERGYYYTWDAATTVCPNGWRLPVTGEITLLANYVNGNTASTLEKDPWVLPGSLNGQYYTGGGTWQNWNALGTWYGASSRGQRLLASGGTLDRSQGDGTSYYGVRCIQEY
jgi:hypothetical protein